MRSFPSFDGVARASTVNRTHRIVREEALKMRAKQEKTRSLWVPLGIFSVLLPVICYAVWAVLDEYDLAPNGIPDASDQLAVFLLWLLPVSALALGSIWHRRTRSSREAA